MTRREQALFALETLKHAWPGTVPHSALVGVSPDVLTQLHSMGEITCFALLKQSILRRSPYDPKILDCFGPLFVTYILGIPLNEKQAVEMYALREWLKATDPTVPVPLMPCVPRPFSHWIGFPSVVYHNPVLPESYHQEATEGVTELPGFPLPSREDHGRLLNDWILFSDACMARGWTPTDRPKWWFVCDTEEEK